MFNLLGFEAVLNCDYFRDGTYGGKDKLVKKDQQINKVKHECVIEIEVEIGKQDERRDVMLDTNMNRVPTDRSDFSPIGPILTINYLIFA